MKRDPYEELPAVPTFQLQSTLVADGETMPVAQRSGIFGDRGGGLLLPWYPGDAPATQLGNAVAQAYARRMPRVEAAYLRAAAIYERAAAVHEDAAKLFDGMGLRSMARSERAHARLDREGALVEREHAQQRHERIALGLTPDAVSTTDFYRHAAVEGPEFGHLTFWTIRPEYAEWLARWEAPGDTLPKSRPYLATVVVGDDVESQSIEAIQRLYGQPLRPEDVIAWAKGNARDDSNWVQLTDHGETWKGAFLYLGYAGLPAGTAPEG